MLRDSCVRVQREIDLIGEKDKRSILTSMEINPTHLRLSQAPLETRWYKI